MCVNAPEAISRIANGEIECSIIRVEPDSRGNAPKTTAGTAIIESQNAAPTRNSTSGGDLKGKLVVASHSFDYTYSIVLRQTRTRRQVSLLSPHKMAGYIDRGVGMGFIREGREWIYKY